MAPVPAALARMVLFLPPPAARPAPVSAIPARGPLADAGGARQPLPRPPSHGLTPAAAQVHALRKLHRLVDQCWAEIADAVPQIESLAEDDQFPERELAAAVAAKVRPCARRPRAPQPLTRPDRQVFYHLEEYDDALRVALRSGAYFDTQDGSDYSQRLLGAWRPRRRPRRCLRGRALTATPPPAAAELCVDKFTAHNRAAYFGEQEGQLDQRLVSIVDDLFERCFAQNQFSQALGIALESHRLDKMRDVVAHCPDQPRLLSQCLSLAKTMIASKRFRTDVLRVLIEVRPFSPGHPAAGTPHA